MKVGFLLYDKVTALDLFGPLDIISRVASWDVELFACDEKKCRIGNGISIEPQTVISNSTKYDVIVIPGGIGQISFCENQSFLDLIRNVCINAKYTLAICTGSIIIGFCGLLKGKRATTNQFFFPAIEKLGAIPVNERVVEDQKILTCGGVTSGIDLALYFVRKIKGDLIAKKIQLSIEYNPQPPYNYELLTKDKQLTIQMNQDIEHLIIERNNQIDQFLNYK